MKQSKLCLFVIGCLLLGFSFTASAQWCDPDVVTAWATGSTITVSHENAEFNCCMGIQFLLIPNDYMLDLYEVEFGMPCFCTCCFDLITTIVDVAPGTYLVRVFDAVTEEMYGQVWVTVEGADGARAGLGDTEQSPCGGWPSAVPDEQEGEEEELVSWGSIKALYR